MNLHIFETNSNLKETFAIDVRNLNISPTDVVSVNWTERTITINGWVNKYVVVGLYSDMYKLEGLQFDTFTVSYRFYNTGLREHIIHLLQSRAGRSTRKSSVHPKSKVSLDGTKEATLIVDGVTFKGHLKGVLEVDEYLHSSRSVKDTYTNKCSWGEAV